MGLGSSSAESPRPAHSSLSCITAYSQRQHAGVLSCRFDAVKGRVLHSERDVQAGEKILTEAPLIAVRCDPTNALYLKVEQLCEQHGFCLDPIWYWCALNSVYPDTAPRRDGLKAVDEHTRASLRLLHAPAPISPSAEVKTLLEEFQLEAHVTAEDLEFMLQVWIHNCFEQYDDPVGFVIFFLPSFTSHSCLPNAFWYFDAENNFVLHARAHIRAGEEVSLSYLSEDDLLKPTLLRRQILSETKSFWCTCERCSNLVDFSRGFRCMRCGVGCIYVKPTAALSDEEVDEVLAAHADSSAGDFLLPSFVLDTRKNKGKADISANEEKAGTERQRETTGELTRVERRKTRHGRERSCKGGAGGSLASATAEGASSAVAAAAAGAPGGQQPTPWKASAASTAATAAAEDADAAEVTRGAAAAPAGNAPGSGAAAAEAAAAGDAAAAGRPDAAAGRRDEAAAVGLGDAGGGARNGAAAAAAEAAKVSCRAGGGSLGEEEANALQRRRVATAADSVCLDLCSPVGGAAAEVIRAAAAASAIDRRAEIPTEAHVLAATDSAAGASGRPPPAARHARHDAAAAAVCSNSGSSTGSSTSSGRSGNGSVEILSPRFASASSPPRRNGMHHLQPTARRATVTTSTSFSSFSSSCGSNRDPGATSTCAASLPSGAPSSPGFPSSALSSADSSKLCTTQESAAVPAAAAPLSRSSSAFLYSVEDEQSWLPTYRSEIPLAIWLLLTAPHWLLRTRVAGARAVAQHAAAANTSSSGGQPAASSDGTCFEMYAVLSELRDSSSRRDATTAGHTAAAAAAENGCGAGGAAGAEGNRCTAAAAAEKEKEEEKESAAATERRGTTAAARGRSRAAVRNEWAAAREGEDRGPAATRAGVSRGISSAAGGGRASAADEEAVRAAEVPAANEGTTPVVTVPRGSPAGERRSPQVSQDNGSTATTAVSVAAEVAQRPPQPGRDGTIGESDAMWGDPEKLRSFALSVLFDLKCIKQLMAAAVPDVCTTCSSKWSEEEKKRSLAVEACIQRWGSPWGPPDGETPTASSPGEAATAAAEATASEEAAARARAVTKEETKAAARVSAAATNAAEEKAAAAAAAESAATVTAAASTEVFTTPAAGRAGRDRDVAAEKRASTRSRGEGRGHHLEPEALESPVFPRAADGDAGHSKCVRRTTSRATAASRKISSSSSGRSNDNGPSVTATARKGGGSSTGSGIRRGARTAGGANVTCGSRRGNRASSRNNTSGSDGEKVHPKRRDSSNSNSKDINGCVRGTGSTESCCSGKASKCRSSSFKRSSSKRNSSHKNASITSEKCSNNSSTCDDSRSRSATCAGRTRSSSSTGKEKRSGTGRRHSSSSRSKGDKSSNSRSNSSVTEGCGGVGCSWQQAVSKDRKRRGRRSRSRWRGGGQDGREALACGRTYAHSAEAVIVTSTWAHSSMSAINCILKKPWTQLETEEKDLLHGLLFSLYNVHWHIACWLQERLCEYTGKDFLLASDALAWQQRNLYPGVSAALGWSLNSLADTFLQSYVDQEEESPRASRASVEKLLLDARGRAACSESHFLLFLLFRGCPVVSSSLLRLNSLMKHWIAAHALEGREESAPWVEMLQHQQQQHQRLQNREQPVQQEPEQQKPDTQQQQPPQSQEQQQQQRGVPAFYCGFTSPALVFEPHGACTLVDRHLCCR